MASLIFAPILYATNNLWCGLITDSRVKGDLESRLLLQVVVLFPAVLAAWLLHALITARMARSWAGSAFGKLVRTSVMAAIATILCSAVYSALIAKLPPALLQALGYPIIAAVVTLVLMRVRQPE